VTKKSLLESVTRSVELAAEGKIAATQDFIDAELHELLEVCNGCGSSQAKFDFVPDHIYGLWIGPICNVHDWDYSKGTTAADKLRADLHMLENILRAIEAKSNRFLKKIRRIRALTYYQAVRDFGDKAFFGDSE
jgi:hypothetical protein